MSYLELLTVENADHSKPLIYLTTNRELNTSELGLSQDELKFLNDQLNQGISIAELISPQKKLFVLAPHINQNKAENCEKYRRTGASLVARLNSLKQSEVTLSGQVEPDLLAALAEGIVLSSYKFSKYKSEKISGITKVRIVSDSIQADQINELNILLEATCIARDLVNEPVLFLTAEQMSEEIVRLGEEVGFSVEVFNKSKIQSLKMGGLLAVNAGSPNPPTFTILEYKSPEAIQTKPIVLVGKGVVYDTGGLSLKPTEHSMDMMKCDMAGAGAVIGAFYAVAKNKLPVHIIGLIPATENRPDGNAITPGDIITMHNGKTVEILNTDAEGRLILGDALSYAKKYDPALVIDLATLTGSAVRAIGKEAIVYMGTADQKTKEAFETAAWQVFERLVEFPLWEDYDEHIQSDVADIKNIGTSEAGAISAGKFLEHFTSYPWLHLDIAAGAFMMGPFHYWVKGGTGIGVRLLYRFLKNQLNK